MLTSTTYLTVEQAQRIVLEHVRPGRTVTLPLDQALGYTLAEPVCTDIDYPPFDRSVMDGFAVRAEDVRGAPTTLKLVGQIAAGAAAKRPLETGEAIQVNTGAPIPAGADAVARLEETEVLEHADSVRILAAVKSGQHIAYRGEYAHRGETALAAGRQLGPAQVGVAGSAGAHRVTVYDRPLVSVLSTGDELVEVHEVPSGPQIRNSNSHLLMALVEQAHGRGINLGNVRDDRAAIADAVERGLESEVLCITGGVSMGQFDLVPAVLRDCGVSVQFHKMKSKPGKPTLFGVARGSTLVFGLPGNPISAFVGFWLLVRPALAAIQGLLGELPRPVCARLRGKLKPSGDRQSYVPAKLDLVEGEFAVEPVPWGGSGDPFGMAQGDAMIVRAIDAPQANEGDRVEVLLLGVV